MHRLAGESKGDWEQLLLEASKTRSGTGSTLVILSKGIILGESMDFRGLCEEFVLRVSSWLVRSGWVILPGGFGDIPTDLVALVAGGVL